LRYGINSSFKECTRAKNTVIDLYCERTAIGLLNEPFNAVSNIAFLIVAILAWRKLGVRAYGDYCEKGVIILAGMIGIGSLLFHTFATNWAAQADIIPIWMFVGSYILLIIYRLSGQNGWKALAAALIISAVMLSLHALTSDSLGTGVNTNPLIFNGSLQYLPALAALIAFSMLAHLSSHAMRHQLLVASALFLASLGFRSIDIATCDATLGTGTHFLWHLFNALVIRTLLQALIDKLPPLNGDGGIKTTGSYKI
jgi:hypothetical protein